DVGFELFGTAGLRVIGRQRRHYRAEDAHGVGMRREPFKELFLIFGNETMVFEGALVFLKLFLRWELAVDQEMAHLDEGGRLRQLFNGISPVAENAFFADDVDNGTFAGSRISVTGVEGNGASLRPKIPDVDRNFTFRTDDNR